MVHVRSIEGKDLTFIVSGMLWRNSLVMQDEQTDTLWSHVTGEAIRGPLANRRLEMVAVAHTTWAEWKRAHPGTRVLKKERVITSSAYEKYARDPEKFGNLRTRAIQRLLPAKALGHGVVLRGAANAAPDAAIRADEPVLGKVGDRSVRFQRGPDGGMRAFNVEPARS